MRMTEAPPLNNPTATGDGTLSRNAINPLGSGTSMKTPMEHGF